MAKQRKIKMLVSMAGPEESFQPGQEYDVAERLAVALCTLPEDGPRAEPVGWDPAEAKKPKAPRAPKKPAEAAALKPNENAAKPPARRRSRKPGK